MTRFPRWGACLFSLALLLAAGEARARGLALVLGNDRYRSVPVLETAVTDAQSVGDTMERLGFNVRRGADMDRHTMSQTLAAFTAALRPGDEAFLFYAGHGIEIAGENYLLPTDVPAVRFTESQILRDASFPVSRIIDDIRERGVRVTILVLDSCRDNPFAVPGSRSAAAAGGLARVEPPEGVFVLMSAGAKQQALDKLGPDDPVRDSVFTRTFLSQLAVPGRTLVEIAKRTQVDVRDLAASVGFTQTPAYYDQVIGDVVLSGRQETPTPPLPHQAPLAQPAPLTMRTAEGVQLAMTIPRPALPPNVSGTEAPTAHYTRSNAGWTVTLSLPQPAVGLSYRIGQNGAFRSTGLSDTLDPKNGERIPNLVFPLPPTAEATTIEVSYKMASGDTLGPFALRFDPEVALFNDEKRNLELVAPSWVTLGGSDGVIAYFTSLIVYRCAIAEVRYGLNGAPPLTAFILPRCRMEDPFSIPPAAQLFLRLPVTTRSMTVQLTWRDGTQSDVVTIIRN